MRLCRTITWHTRSPVFWIFPGFHAELRPFYSRMGRPSIDPVLVIRMLIIGYVFAIRSEWMLGPCTAPEQHHDGLAISALNAIQVAPS